MPPFHPRRSLRPLRARLPRRALAWYAGAAALTLLTGLTVHTALARAAAARDAYGTTVPVAVVVRDVAAGDALGPDDVEVRPWPRSLAPPDAVADAPTGRTALVDLHPGEALVAGRLSDPDLSGPAALLAPGERAVAVPLAVPGLPLSPGDRVDLLGGTAGGGPGDDLPVGPGAPAVVARDATVLVTGVGGESDGDALASAGPAGTATVVVAVTAAQAADVAAALTAGPVVAALRPPGG